MNLVRASLLYLQKNKDVDASIDIQKHSSESKSNV